MERRLAQSRLHRGRVLECALLGGQQPEHDGGLRARVAERAEVARAGGVVLEQQPVVPREAREDLRRDGFVAAVGEPSAARGIAAADVNRPGHAADALEDAVVDLRVGHELGRHVVAPRLEGGAVVAIHVPLGVVGRVHLDVVAAQGDDPRHHPLPQVAGDRAQEILRGRVGGARVLAMPEDAVPARGGDRELGARARVGLEERVLVGDHVAHDLDRAGDEGPRGSGPHLGAPAVRLLPERPPARIRGQELEAGERRAGCALLAERDRDDPGGAAQLAVGDHVEAGRFLERDGGVDRAVLGRPQRFGRHAPLARTLARLAQIGRAEETAHHVGPRDRHAGGASSDSGTGTAGGRSARRARAWAAPMAIRR